MEGRGWVLVGVGEAAGVGERAGGRLGWNKVWRCFVKWLIFNVDHLAAARHSHRGVPPVGCWAPQHHLLCPVLGQQGAWPALPML